MARIPARIVAGLAAVLLFALVAGYLLKPRADSSKASDSEPGVPVRAALVQVRDVPQYAAAIGTVQALNTVSVRARVDGEIRNVRFREGQDVKRGDVLVELDPRPFEAQLRAAVAQREKDQSQLDNAKVDLERYDFLAKTDSGPKQALDTQRALVSQLAAAVDSDAAQIDAARLQLEYSTIRAPMGGRTGARLVDAGNIVHATDANPLVMLTQIHPVTASFSLPQEMLPQLRAARAHGEVPVTALSQDAATVLDRGTLTLIDNQIDPATGTIRCKATFSNAAEPLWPGQFVGIRAQLGVIAGAIVIPASALATGADGAYVYVVADNKAAVRPVTVGPTLESEVAVLKGLRPGDLVVTEGQFRLEAGARVAVRK